MTIMMETLNSPPAAPPGIRDCPRFGRDRTIPTIEQMVTIMMERPPARQPLLLNRGLSPVA
jgi:hypothetical protein